MPKHFLFVTFLLSACCMPARPQAPYPDSLQNLLKTTRTDTARANLYFLLSDYWSDKDSARAIGYIDGYFRENPRNDYYNAVAHFYRAGAWFDFNIARAQEEYLKADQLLSAFPTREAVLYRARAWHNYAVLEQRKDDNRSFIDIQLNKAIPLSLQAGDTGRVAWNYKEVGMVFMNFEEYAKAQQYYNLALNLLRRPTADKEVMADCYVNIAKAYLLQENPSAARKPLDTAGQLLSAFPNSTYQPARCLAEGMYYCRIGEGQKAIDSLDKGLALTRRQHRTYDEYSILYGKYDVYRREKKYPRARAILDEVYAFDQRLPLANNSRLILHELALTEAAMGHMDSAYHWLDRYARLSDSMAKTGTSLQIADLEAKYRSSEKEKELLELSNRSKLQRLLLSGGILLLAIGLLFFIYRSRQRKLQNEQAVQSLQQQQQIEMAGALMNGEERERRRLARELHDGLGGMLAGVKINLSEIASNPVQDTPAMAKVIRQLDNSVRELRHIAHNLMPETLIRSGLQVALRDLCESLGNEHTRVELQLMNIGDIPAQTQLIIYRIIQELLANVLKHAKATEVFVQCSQSENIFYITVEDDGVGIPGETSDGPKGIGLENIRRRVEYLKGRLEIDSTPGNGTTINIEIHVA